MTRYQLKHRKAVPYPSRELPVTSHDRHGLRTETRIWWHQLKQMLRDRFAIPWIQRKLIRVYFALPVRMQYRLAKFGIHFIIRKKTARFSELIRH